MKVNMIHKFTRISITAFPKIYPLSFFGQNVFPSRGGDPQPQGKNPLQTNFVMEIFGDFPLRGGYSPFPLSFFEHNDCPSRGGGTPNSAKENSAKKQVF